MAGCDPGDCGAPAAPRTPPGSQGPSARTSRHLRPRAPSAAAPAPRACPALQQCPRPRPPRPRGRAEMRQLPDRACARPAAAQPWGWGGAPRAPRSAAAASHWIPAALGRSGEAFASVWRPGQDDLTLGRAADAAFDVLPDTVFITVGFRF